MFIPKAFVEVAIAAQQELVHKNPLAIIITYGPGGINANHIPMFLEPGKGDNFGTLKGHLNRDNPQLKELSDASECLVIFQGPHEYITPTWYHTKKMTQKVVPTWDFAAVHVWGKPRVIDDVSWLKAQTAKLSDLQEQRRDGKPWKLSDAPEPYVNVMLKGIVGLEIEVTRHLGKWKMSQDKKREDILGVVEGLKEMGTTRAAEVSKIVEERAAEKLRT